MSIDLLNKVFVDGELLDASDLNPITSKVDETVTQTNSLTTEVETARDGETSLTDKLTAMDTATTTVTTEVTDARGGEADLDTRLDGMDTATSAVTSEVTTARGTESTLNDRLDTLTDAVTAGANSGIDDADVSTLKTWSSDKIDSELGDKQPILQSSYTQIADASLGTGTHTFDYSAGDRQKLTATGDITLATSNFTTGKVNTFLIEAVNFGDYTITHPATWKFASATAPTYTSGGTDMLLLEKDDDDVYTLYVLAQAVAVVA